MKVSQIGSSAASNYDISQISRSAKNSSGVVLGNNLQYLSSMPQKSKSAVFKCLGDIFKKARDERSAVRLIKRAIQNTSMYFKGLSKSEQKSCAEYLKKLASLIDKNIKNIQIPQTSKNYSKLADEFILNKSNVEYIKNPIGKKETLEQGIQACLDKEELDVSKVINNAKTRPMFLQARAGYNKTGVSSIIQKALNVNNVKPKPMPLMGLGNMHQIAINSVIKNIFSGGVKNQQEVLQNSLKEAVQKASKFSELI